MGRAKALPRQKLSRVTGRHKLTGAPGSGTLCSGVATLYVCRRLNLFAARPRVSEPSSDVTAELNGKSPRAMKRPTVLVIVAWIFIAQGITAMVSIARGIFVQKTLLLDLDFFGLWIGAGLLRGQLSSRKWALFMLRLGLASGAIGFLAIVLWASVPPINVFHQSLGFLSRGYLALTLAVMLVGNIWQLRVLQRPDVHEFFNDSLNAAPPSERSDPRRLFDA
jgi:hypothetical protein